MGRASNRKRARRQAASGPRRAMTEIQLQARRQPALVDRSQALTQAFRAHDERYVHACRVWCGDDPAPAPVPRWAAGPLGGRIPSWCVLGQARYAPCLLSADVPDATVITADPAQWSVATKALVRAVAFDGMEPGHPVLNGISGVLAPVAKAELDWRRALLAWLSDASRKGRGRPEFPILDGPVFLLGMSVLPGLTQALAGSAPGAAELSVLSRALETAVPGVAGSVVADALTEAVNPRYLRQMPAEVRRRFSGPPYANPLETLVTAGSVTPGDVLPAGLAILSALIRRCQNEAAPVSRQAA